ncbi:MAG TPA: DUF2177 family protein [Caldimonas sp.]|nr:DUF2177 family protein [Caldimonas sp.]
MNPTSLPSTIARFAASYAVGAVVFLTLDALWLTGMSDRLYRPAIGHLMRSDFDAIAAGAFYLVYLAGNTVFSVLPARSVRGALVRGAFFGFVAYATYDLTNQATLRGWPWRVTIVDLLWGTIVTGTSAATAFAVIRRRAR